ncbi:hypothetical protein ACJX0J_029099, partial [Zea mays]
SKMMDLCMIKGDPSVGTENWAIDLHRLIANSEHPEKSQELEWIYSSFLLFTRFIPLIIKKISDGGGGFAVVTTLHALKQLHPKNQHIKNKQTTFYLNFFSLTHLYYIQRTMFFESSTSHISEMVEKKSLTLFLIMLYVDTHILHPKKVG